MMKYSFLFCMICVLTIFSGCANYDDYIISSSLFADKVYFGGTVKIESDAVTVFALPENCLVTGDGMILCFPFPPIPIGENYSPKYANFISSDGYFYLQLLLIPKKPDFSFNPIDSVFFDYNGVNFMVDSYVAVHHWHQKPKHLGNAVGVLLAPHKVDKALDNLNYSDNEYRLKENIGYGFVLRFKCPPPLPESSFSFKLNGFKVNNVFYDFPEITFTESKTFRAYSG